MILPGFVFTDPHSINIQQQLPAWLHCAQTPDLLCDDDVEDESEEDKKKLRLGVIDRLFVSELPWASYICNCYFNALLRFIRFSIAPKTFTISTKQTHSNTAQTVE